MPSVLLTPCALVRTVPIQVCTCIGIGDSDRSMRMCSTFGSSDALRPLHLTSSAALGPLNLFVACLPDSFRGLLDDILRLLNDLFSLLLSSRRRRLGFVLSPTAWTLLVQIHDQHIFVGSFCWNFIAASAFLKRNGCAYDIP